MKSLLNAETSIELPEELTSLIDSLVGKVGQYITWSRGAELLADIHDSKEKAQSALDFTIGDPDQYKYTDEDGALTAREESQKLHQLYYLFRKEGSNIELRKAVKEMNDMLVEAIMDRYLTGTPTPQIALLTNEEHVQAMVAIDALKQKAERGNAAFRAVLPQIREALTICLGFKSDPSLLDQPENAQKAIEAKNLLINAINTANRQNLQ